MPRRRERCTRLLAVHAVRHGIETKMTSRALDFASALLHRHRELTHQTVFSLLGLQWDLVPGVFAPHLTRSAALWAEWVPYPVGGAFCEIGCGTGVVAVTAALRGCARVTAIDINPAAVENTRLNAARHGVSARVDAACGDMFAPLRASDRYDVIFWFSNFVDAPDDGSPTTALDRAFFDPGYAAHATLLRDASHHLHPGGRLFLGFTDLGNRNRLLELAARHGWRATIARGVRGESSAGAINYQLVEFHPA